jgi:hypothetical protein
MSVVDRNPGGPHIVVEMWTVSAKSPSKVRLRLPSDAIQFFDKSGFAWMWNEAEQDAVNALCNIALPTSDSRSEPSLRTLIGKTQVVKAPA